MHGHSFLLPPALRPQLPSSFWVSISFLQHMCPAKKGTSSQEVPQQEGSSSPGSSPGIDGASLAGVLAAACPAWQGWGLSQPVVCHLTWAAMRITLFITSHTCTHLGTDSLGWVGQQWERYSHPGEKANWEQVSKEGGTASHQPAPCILGNP